MKKLTTVKGRPGIRKKPNGHYIATKSIKGKRYYKETVTLSAAIDWKNTFSPLVKINRLETESLVSSLVTDQSNGRDKRITFHEAWEKYQKHKLSTLGEQTKYKKVLRLRKFISSLVSVKMCEMNPDVIEALLEEQKLLVKEGSQRCYFHEELKALKSIFLWYQKEYDPTFLSPIRSFHGAVGKIRDVAPKDKNIKPHEIILFLEKLSGQWQNLAYTQLYMSARIQEAAGLQRQFVHFELKQIEVSSVISWVKGVPLPKDTTKTDVVSFVKMNDHMEEILKEQDATRPPGCVYMFHDHGQPLRYSDILETYNAALKEAGLPYSGTHILRYGMAGLAYDFLGDKGSQAATRHDDLRMAQKYRGKRKVKPLTEENTAVVIYAESVFRKSKVRATICDQPNFIEV